MRPLLALLALAACGPAFAPVTAQIQDLAGGKISAAASVAHPPSGDPTTGLPDGGFYFFLHDGETQQVLAGAVVEWGLLNGAGLPESDDGKTFLNCDESITVPSDGLLIDVSLDGGTCVPDYLRPNATR